MAPRYKYVHVDRLPAGRSPAPRYRLAGGLYPRGLDTSPMGADPEKLLQYAEAALKPTQRDIDHCTAEAIRFRIRLFNRAAYTQRQGRDTYAPEPLPAQRARIERLEQEALRLHDDRDKHAPEAALNAIAAAYPNISARDMQLMAQRKDPAEIRRFLESRKAEMARNSLHWDNVVEDIDRGLRSLSLLQRGGKPIAPPSPADHLRDLAMRAEARAKETGSTDARSRARSAWMKVANALEAEGRSDTDLAVVAARNHARMFK
jgi:hypothetical protein